MSLATFQELWGKLTTGDESVDIEVKRCEELGSSLLETICAFANSEQGGYLILGASGGRDARWALPGLMQAPRDLSAWISQAAQTANDTPVARRVQLESHP